MPSKAFKLAEAMVSNPVMSDMVENPTATPTQIAAVETKTSAISDTGIISVNTKNIVSNNVLTQSFDSNQVVGFNLTDSINAVSPIVSVFKEVPVTGVTSKGQWDVNANATNYEFFDEKPISYSSVNLTPSTTGDGTFTSNSPITDIANLSYDNTWTSSSTGGVIQNAPAHDGVSITMQGAGFRAGQRNGQLLFMNSNHDRVYVYDDNAYSSAIGAAGYHAIFSLEVDSDEANWSLANAAGFSHDYNYGSTRVGTGTANQGRIDAIETDPDAFTISNSGNNLTLIGAQNDRLFQWTLNNAYKLSSLSIQQDPGNNAGDYHVSTAVNASTGLAGGPTEAGVWPNGPKIKGICWADNGNKFFLYDAKANNKYIRRYDMGSGDLPYTHTQIEYHSQVSVDSGTTPNAGTSSSSVNPGALFVANDGSRLVLVTGADDGTPIIIDGSFGTAFDLSTITWGTRKVPSDFGGSVPSTWTHMGFSEDGAKLLVQNTYLYVIDLGAGSVVFSSSDVGKKVVGNSGSAIITSTAGAYTSVTPFADTSAISSWQLFGAQGKADGSGIELSGLQSLFNISSSTLSYTWNTSAFSTTLRNMSFKPDGTRVIFDDSGSNNLHSVNLSTAWDLSTATLHHTKSVASLNGGGYGIYFKPDGTILWLTSGSVVYPYYLSSAWDISSTWTNYSGSHAKSLGATVGSARDVHFSTDGTKMYVLDFTNRRVTEWDCSTAFRADTATYNNVLLDVYYNSSNLPMGMEFSSDGTILLVISEQRNLLKYNLSTAWDLSTATYDSLKAVGSSGGGYGLGIDTAGENFYVTIPNVANDPVLQYHAAASNSMPYSQYIPALTNSSTGQINSSSWQDINAMTADETKNGGDIFYAVSTDNRTSWDVAKGSDGVRKIVKNNSGTWQYNNDGGTSTSTYYDLINVSYDNKKYVAAQLSGPEGIAFKSDGTAMYITGYDNDTVYQYTLSTAWDVSTASYANKSLSVASQNTAPRDIRFKPDGTIMYIVGSSSPDSVYQYNLSTAWDVSTASYANKSINVSSQDTNPTGLVLSPDGTKVYICGYSSKTIFQYNLSTAWDLSTSSYSNNSLSLVNDFNYNLNSISINPTGTKIYISNDAGYTSNNMVAEYNLPSDGDISNLTHVTNHDFTGLVFTQNVLVGSTKLSGIFFSGAGDKFYSVGNVVTDSYGGNEATVYQFSTGGTTIDYATSETWVNGTNNNEHATLQQALTSQAFNRMDKAQLDAVADGYHFSQDSANTLDLMIAPYAASGSSPISDGVTINYDAEAIIREAIPGTDYVAEFPNSSTINIKSLVNANIKVRAL